MLRQIAMAAALAVAGAWLGTAVAAEGAAAPAQAKRPKICLVLSGGGARGAAHIGVLKVLEEMRIPIDCITGTSMGSIVGGAYASGTSIAEMEQVIGSMSTDLLFKEKPPRQERPFRRKRDDRLNLVTPEVGLRDGGIHVPKGFVSGVQLETYLRRFDKAPGYRDFDRLPIPFRAVATDLVTGKPVVFARGELANVMRASMSVPGAIAPAQIDGMLLVDGGLTNNLPVDVARAMGADIVIAVNLGTPLLRREQLGSVFGVTGQMISILTEQNVQASLASLKPTDVLIEPELGDFSAGDFDHLPKTLPIGEAAVRKAAPRLARYSLTPEAYAALRTQQTTVPAPDSRPVDEVRFVRLDRVNPAMAKKEMETRPGEPLDPDRVDRDMRRLYGTEEFEHVNFRVLQEPGRRILAVDALEKEWGPNYLRLGLGLSSDFQGDAFFNLLASYRMTWLNRLGGEWRNDLQIGRTSALISEFYQPLTEDQRFFVAPRVQLEQRAISVFRGNERLAQYDVNSARVGLDVGSNFARYGEARVGAFYGTQRSTLDTGSTLFPSGDTIPIAAFTGRVTLDQLDNVNFPRSGYIAQADITASRTAIGAEQNYTKWVIDALGAYSIGDNTFQVAGRFGGAIGSDRIPSYDQFRWGGMMQQSGFRTGALTGQTIGFGRVAYYNKLVKQTLLEGLYAGASLEAGRVGDPLIPGGPTGLQKSGSVFLAYDSPLGPLYLAYGQAAGGYKSVYLFLGKP